MWGSGLLVILLSGGILASDWANRGQQLNCNTEDVLMKCKNTGNGGHTYYNHGTEWDPYAAIWGWDDTNQEDCHPCCKDPNTSIAKCPDTDLPDEKGVSYDQLRDLEGLRGWKECRVNGKWETIR